MMVLRAPLSEPEQDCPLKHSSVHIELPPQALFSITCLPIITDKGMHTL